MGVITDLIRTNEGKKLNDRMQQIDNWKFIAGLPDDIVPRDKKEWAVKNLAGMTSEALGLPKQHHGIMHGLISSIAGLNPMPGKEKAPAGPMPGGPMMLSEDQGRAVRGRQAQETRETEAAAQQSKFNQAESQAAATQNRRMDALKSIKDMLTPEEYQTDLQQIQGFKTTAPLTESHRPGRLKMPDGKEISVTQGTKTNKIYDLQGNEIDVPQGAEFETQQRKPINAALEEKTAEFVAIGYSPVAARLEAGKYLLENGYSKQELAEANVQAKRQAIGVTGALSDISGTPGTHYQAPGLSPGNSPTKTPATPPASGNQPVAGPGPGKAASPAGSPGASPAASPSATPAANSGNGAMAWERMRQDPQVQQYIMAVLKEGPNPRGSGPSYVPIKRGMLKLLKYMPGITPEKLGAEVIQREGIKKQMTSVNQRIGAFDQVAQNIQGMGDVLTEAYKQHGNDPGFWRRLKEHVSKNIWGDPEIDRIRTAIEGYKTSYGKFMSGGQMSNAQINVHAQERTADVIDSAMRPDQIKKVLKQVSDEAVNEHQSLVKNIQQLRQQYSVPLGQLSDDPQDPNTPGREETGTAAPTTPAKKGNSAVDNFLAKHGLPN